jgi:LuxR family transcriptional regulator, maltose regulon positive regulatory protein
MGVIPTTVVPPRTAHKYVSRKSIEGLAEQVGQSRVVTVSSPAGFGKTTAMLRWAEVLQGQGRTVLWIAARAGVDSLASFQDAFRLALVGAGFPAAEDPDDSQMHAFLGQLSATSAAKPVLFIDDAQLLDEACHGFIEQLIASARDAMTTVIASRGECRFSIARLRSLGHLLEVRMKHLCFEREEAATLLRQQLQSPITDAELQEIILDTQGWAAGLILAACAWRRDLAEGVAPEQGATGLRHEFASYFHEEVVEELPQDLRDFLIDTSVLHELTPSACAAVVNSEKARLLLEQAFERGLFVIELDRERSRYRYHSLFREMVFGRLMMRAPARAAELHRRASRYFGSTGELQDAVDHGVRSGDDEFLAEQLDALAEPLIYNGLLYRLDELASNLPWEAVQGRPMLLLAISWRHSRRLAFKSSERLIEAAEAALVSQAASGELDERAADQIAFRVRHRKVMLEAARDNMTFVEREAEALLYDLGDDDPYLSCTLLAQLLAARRELYHFHDMLRLEAELRKALGRPGSDFASIALKSSVAPTLVAQGKTSVARQFLTEAHALAVEMEGEVSGISALPGLPLAEIHYECGELKEASQLVDQYLPAVRQWGFVDQLASGYHVRARLAAAAGDYASALSGLEEAHLVAIECGLDRLRALVISEQVRLLIKLGRVEQAEQLFWSCDLRLKGEPVPTTNPSRLNEWMAMAWLRLEMHRHRLVRSRKIAKRWLEFVRRRGAIRSAVTFELLLAEIAVLSGNRSEARRSVRAAVELAEPAGWVRPFVDEGEAIGTLLVEAYGNGPVLDSPVDQFAARLVSVVKGTPQIEEVEDEDGSEYGPGGGLSLREAEILTLVSGGLRNREIGDRLGLTEGTVKWYMQQIYDKLGVRRRPQAVIRARQFGILA